MSVDRNSQRNCSKYKAGLIIDFAFHQENKWTNVTTPHLVEAVRSNFDCLLIQNQSDYENSIGQLDLLISMEPHWGGCHLEFKRTKGLSEQIEKIPSYIFVSDPHAKKWRQDYFLNNAFDYFLSFYYYPTRYHFRKISPDRILHFPWAIPDRWIGTEPIQFHHTKNISCFGGAKSQAYTLRNWCREFDFVESSSNSGCENKAMSDSEYIHWLTTKDACVAAGSDDIMYRLTVPKYFETAAAGALLFAQETDDLALLGFVHGQNCLVFNRNNFQMLADRYLENPESFLGIRQNGRELIRRRHSISVRMANLTRHVDHAIKQKRHSKTYVQVKSQKPGCRTQGPLLLNSPIEKKMADLTALEKEFGYWFRKICIPQILKESYRGDLEWQGCSLEWEACHEILAYHSFVNKAVDPEKLIAVSNHRYELLDRLWPDEPITKEKVETFYHESAKVLPWGHGIFKPDHNVRQRRQIWLKRVRLLEMLRQKGVTSVCDYGAGGGHTSLLAKAMGFSRVIHHEYSVFHPYVAWREKHIQIHDADQRFILTPAEEALRLEQPVDAIICMDVAEHVWEPEKMLRDIHSALKPGGYLLWNSVFGEGISCHLHPDLKGKEVQLLADCGYIRAGDLPVEFIGHCGVYQSVSVPQRSLGPGQNHSHVNNNRSSAVGQMTIDERMEQNQWLNAEQLRDYQWKMLKLLLDHAYRNVPFYRRFFKDNGAHPEDIRTLEDYRQLPIVRKADIQQSTEAMRADNYPDNTVIRDATGGSTGQPLVFYRDINARDWLWAASRRFRRWMGYDSNSKLALIWGADRDLPTSQRQNQRWLNAFNCSQNDIETFMAELVAWQPDAIRAYSSSIAMVASYMIKHNIQAPRPKVIECAAEKLWDVQRKQVEQVFGCPVFEMYGSRELPALACECEQHNGMHVFSDVRLIEAINDGRPAQEGQEGSLIITDLVNYGMPFIRYEIEDVGIISHESCPCGRSFPLLKEIKGRISSTIQAPDGRRIHGEFFTHLFYHAPGIKAFQIYQKTIHELLVRIQPEVDFDRSVAERIVATIRDHLGTQVRVEWMSVDEIPSTPTGKRHFTISDVPADYLARQEVPTVTPIQCSTGASVSDKQKVLFIVDRPGWAHDFKTDNLIKHLGASFDMEKAYCDHVSAEQIQCSDLVLIYYWKQLQYENMQKLIPELRKNRHKVLMGICSHHELEGKWRPIALSAIKEFASGVFMNSKLLIDEFAGEFDVPVFYTPNGVDTQFFVPRKKELNNQPLLVGWAGSVQNHGDKRGYYEYIVPAVGKTKNVKLLTAAREDQWRSKEQMRDFYQQLDLYICASRTEGTPNPCLEAMSCGVPVLTTPVGNMPQLIRQGINGYFIERDIHNIVFRLKYLADRRPLLSSLSGNARQTILAWDWEHNAQHYRKMFETASGGTGTRQRLKKPDREVLDIFRDSQEQFALGNMVTAKRLNEQYREAMKYDSLKVRISESRKPNPLFSVVIVTYNRPEQLQHSIRSLEKQQCRDFEIVIVDNGDAGRKASHLADQVDAYVDCPVNFNLSEGRNIGAHFASGQILVFLDDDALVGPEYLITIRKAFEQYDIHALRGRAFPKKQATSDQQVDIYDFGESPAVSLCNQEGNSAFRRDAYLAVGGMDPLLFGHEGSDISYRLMQQFQHPSAVLYWPQTIIYHDYGSGDKYHQKKKRYERNRDYLRYKYDIDVIGLKDDIAKVPLKPNTSGRLLPPLPETRKCAEQSLPVTAHVSDGPKVSVIMSCHNAARFLPETVDSVLNQTLTDWELLITDDGSTDQTKSILMDYANRDSRIRVWFFDERKGPYVRRNFAIQQAKAPFISIQDADDIMAPNKLKILFEEISREETYAIVGSHYRRFLNDFRGEDFGDRMYKKITHKELMDAFVRTWHLCWHGSAIIRRSLFDTIGLYDEQPYGSDTFWLSKAGLYGLLTGRIKFKNVPEFLTYKREHAQSQTGRISPIDPRSRRHRLERYYLQKLHQIMTEARKDPSINLVKKIRECSCTDFIPKYSPEFERWESVPVDQAMIQGIINRAMAQFASEEYVSALITLIYLDQMIPDAGQVFKNLDLTRGLASYACGDDSQAAVHFEQDIRQSQNQSSQYFLRTYLRGNESTISAVQRRATIRQFIDAASQTNSLSTSPSPDSKTAAEMSGHLQQKLTTARQFLNQGHSQQAANMYRDILSDNMLAKHIALKEKLQELVGLIESNTARQTSKG